MRIYHQLPPRCKENPNPLSCRRSTLELGSYRCYSRCAFKLAKQRMKESPTSTSPCSQRSVPSAQCSNFNTSDFLPKLKLSPNYDIKIRGVQRIELQTSFKSAVKLPLLHMLGFLGIPAMRIKACKCRTGVEAIASSGRPTPQTAPKSCVCWLFRSLG